MSLKSEREKAAQGLMNEETGCSHIPNFSALDCSECGRNALIALQRAAEKRAMCRLSESLGYKPKGCHEEALEILFNRLLDEKGEA